MIDADDVRPAADAASAGEAMRPVLLLLVADVLVHGAWYLLDATLLAGPQRLSWETSCAISGVLFAIVVGVFAWRDRASCRLFVRPRRGMVELCLLVGTAGGLLLFMWENTLPGASPSVIAAERDASWPLGLSLLTSALLPTVVEEVMFRGLILQRLRMVATWQLAVAVQAALFAVLHLDPIALLPHFVFGCLAGFLRIAAGALWPCLLMHFVWNGTMVLGAHGWL